MLLVRFYSRALYHFENTLEKGWNQPISCNLIPVTRPRIAESVKYFCLFEYNLWGHNLYFHPTLKPSYSITKRYSCE